MLEVGAKKRGTAINFANSIGCPGDLEITSSKELAEYIGLSTRAPFYLLIDEAQLTYADRVLWTALLSSFGGRSRNFWVIVAGSYGSHTGSSCHSPPREIPHQLRMNLFSADSELSLAFTQQDFDDYMTLHRLEDWQEVIKSYASPTRTTITWKPGFHPGVVAALSTFLSSYVRCLVA